MELFLFLLLHLVDVVAEVKVSQIYKCGYTIVHVQWSWKKIWNFPPICLKCQAAGIFFRNLPKFYKWKAKAKLFQEGMIFIFIFT